MSDNNAEPGAGRFWNKRNWPVVIGIVLVTCSIVDWEYRLNFIDRLKSELAATQKQVRDLNDQLSPFQLYANAEYQRDLSLLAKDLGEFDKMKSYFRPLDAPSRNKVVAAFRTLQTTYGTTPLQVELTGEIGNTNLNLVVDELASILKEAGLEASVGQPQVTKFSTSSNAWAQIQIGCNPGEVRLRMPFAYAMVDEFMFQELQVATNISQTGKLTVHVSGNPRFSADGHVTFPGGYAAPGLRDLRAHRSDILATRSN